MKKILIVLAVLIVSIFIISLFSNEFTYVGAGKCKICHKTQKQGEQYPLWEARKHSKSFQALSSEQAQEIAQQLGLEMAPADCKDCLKCHAPLHEKAPEFKEEGVTCEVCHGPGSAYKKLSIMKSREQSVANGLKLYDSSEEIKAQCLTCHENAHGKSFDFDAAWEKVKHPVPEKNQ